MGDSAESLPEYQEFPKLTQASGKELIEISNNLRVNKRKKNSQGCVRLFPSSCSLHEEISRNVKEYSAVKVVRWRGNNVFMLRLKHAKLMASLFFLARKN